MLAEFSVDAFLGNIGWLLAAVCAVGTLLGVAHFMRWIDLPRRKQK